ncbi:MAG: hypothetical protein KYX64_09925 [Sphingopyxis sp.]|nr:hypothetical protein [Sphingopyxis sp.]
MLKAAMLAAMTLSVPVHAASPQPPVTQQSLLDQLKPGEEIEARVDGDLNGDGDMDTAFIAAGPDARRLYVILSYRSDVDMGHQPGGDFSLEPYPLGSAELSIARNILTISDLTGGTTALAAKYRYRAVTTPAGPRMRLIGLDATLYSRTYAHDGSEMSWNVMTGDTIVSQLKLTATRDGYDKTATRKFKRTARTIYMEDTPAAEEELASATKAR